MGPAQVAGCIVQPGQPLVGFTADVKGGLLQISPWDQGPGGLLDRIKLCLGVNGLRDEVGMVAADAFLLRG